MGRSLSILLVTVLFVSAFSVDAAARSGRERQIPNNIFGCEVCHTQAGGLNDFGFDSFDYTSGGTVDWPGLSQEDSDRDGYSNGLELGDPNGTGATPSGGVTHPGDPREGLCGNGSMEGAEECESGNLGGATCASLGLISGTLGCTMCRYDTSSCDSCGDGMLQGGEECDGADLGGNTCETLGRGTGTLSCNGCSYDYSGCTSPNDDVSETCGNGLLEAGEQCDSSNLGGQTCATQGFAAGILSCAVRCTFDTSACTGGTGIPSGGSDAPGPTTPTGPTTTPNVQDDPDQKIELSGYACSTTANRAGTSGAALLLVLLGLVARRRRASTT